MQLETVQQPLYVIDAKEEFPVLSERSQCKKAAASALPTPPANPKGKRKATSPIKSKRRST